jgi:hypothetical protein
MYTKHKLKFCEEIVTFNSSCVNDYKKKINMQIGFVKLSSLNILIYLMHNWTLPNSIAKLRNLDLHEQQTPLDLF